MGNFIKDIAKIKLTQIARKNKLDYSNIIKEKAKKEDIEKFEKELKKEILISLVKENLNDIEKVSFLELRDFFNNAFSDYHDYYTIDQSTLNSIYILYKIFEE